MKKCIGIGLLALGGMMLLSGIQLAVTKYDFSDEDQLSGFIGAMGFSLLLAVAGLGMFLKAAKDEKAARSNPPPIPPPRRSPPPVPQEEKERRDEAG